MTKTVGTIRIDRISASDGQFYRLTIDTELPYLDELEAVGETLEEAFAILHEKIEVYG